MPPPRSKWTRLSPGRAQGAARAGAVDALAVDRALVVDAAGAERDVVAPELAVLQRHGIAARGQRARHLLEVLLQRQLALRQVPGAVDLGGHDPQVGRAPGAATLADRGGF